MYYRVEHAQIRWHNQILQAKPIGETAEHQMRQKPHWWEAEPWVSLPPLSFAIDSRAQLLDNYDTGTLFDLYSARLIKLLRDADVRCELFPATIIDQKTHEVLTAVTDKTTGETLPVDYEVFHLLEKRSRKEVRAEEGPTNRRLMFRDADYMDILFMHEDLKAVLDRERITGFVFSPGDRYGLGK